MRERERGEYGRKEVSMQRGQGPKEDEREGRECVRWRVCVRDVGEEGDARKFIVLSES